MHIFGVSFIISAILYSIFQQPLLILYFCLTILLYLLLSKFLPKSLKISNRKKIMVATWQNPAQGNLRLYLRCRVEKCEQIIRKYNELNIKLTLTHFVIKAAGQIFKQCQQINGKLAFGKFIPHNSVSISCLVDIDNGQDLALILVRDVDKKNVQQVAQFIKQKGMKIKKSKGDTDHKKRNQPAQKLPAFLISALLQISRFCVNKLGISIQPLALRRHQFGAACVTSLGMLNLQDATPPFSAFTDCTMLIASGTVQELPVIQNGKVQPGRVMMCNFTIDSRHIDFNSEKMKNIVAHFKRVFEQPQLFVNIDNLNKLKQSKKTQ